ncbi:MAG: S9 family peptidase, partial [SAR202 cluster bacterium]|nr:S9 family peptidase [SAR202 cluster bacterium]
MTTKTKRRITAEDLYRIQQISGPEISPDGKHVVFSLSRVDRKTEKKYANLWIVPTSGGRDRQFTYGDQTDTQPHWSPDGQEIAFLSNRGDSGQSQIFVIPFLGGEARPLTSMKGKFGSVEWSPDGRQLLCEFQKMDADAIERDEDQDKGRLGIVYRHITRVNYKTDGVGFLPDERWHIWTVNARNGKSTQITDSEVADEREPRWTPDGESIIFKSNRSDDPDFNPDTIDLWAVPAKGGDLKRITSTIGRKSNPSVSPDGQWVAYTGKEKRSDWWQNENLFVMSLNGDGQPRNLTGEFDIEVSNAGMSDLGGADTSPPVWSNDSQTIYFQISRHGNVTLNSLSLNGGEMETVIDGPGVVGSWSLDAAGERVAYFHGDFADTGQVWARDIGDGGPRKLTRINQNIIRSVDLGEIEEVWFEGAAGNDLQGWILKPPDFDPSKTYPSILEIHGGPMGQYGNMFMHEFYYLAAQGYVVYFSNPRGGSGYGEDHAKAIWNAAGTADYADIMAWADFVENQPYIDADRMGVTGGSYGGFLVNWIIGHTDKFKATVSLRSIVNRFSNYGTSDMNWIR